MKRPATCHPERSHHAHGLCKKCYYALPAQREKRHTNDRRVREEHPEEYRSRNHAAYLKYKPTYLAAAARWNKANPEKRKLIQRKTTLSIYGLTTEQYAVMLAAQNGGCKICGGLNPSGRRLAVDHDHHTGKIRGILCSRCNSGIANFKDAPELLAKAIQYLQENTKLRSVK